MAKTKNPLAAITFSALNRLVGGFVKTGSLTLIDGEGARRTHGKGAPHVAVRIADPAVQVKILFNPELAAGEAYMDGALTIEDGSLSGLLQIFHRNAPYLRSRELRRLAHDAAVRIRRFRQFNTAGRARRNVAHHYDLSNDFFRLFLDEDLNYSCAYFTNADRSLESAQQAKLRHIAAKLRLERGMRVLDIGCGWGAMAIYLARRFDVRVVGVTLSKEQIEVARARADASGVGGLVDFQLKDYREIEGRFDRIVSIGMFEHVGVPHYEKYFAKIADLLSNNGVALVHSIGRKGPPGTTGPWIRKYIFPGGYSPALSETLAAVERTGLWTTDIEILRLHYAETLREWRRRFQANRAAVRGMFDERFCRMWEFYLASAEFAFRCGGQMVFQLQLAKSHAAVPIRRDYMAEAERALAASGPLPASAQVA